MFVTNERSYGTKFSLSQFTIHENCAATSSAGANAAVPGIAEAAEFRRGVSA